MKTSKITGSINYIDDELITLSEDYHGKKSRLTLNKHMRPALVASFSLIILLCLIYICNNRCLKSNLIDQDEADTIQCLEKITELVLESDSNIYSLDSINIAAGEMVILNINSTVEENEKSCFRGYFSSDDLCYAIGYLIDGEYYEIQRGLTNAFYNNSVSADKSEEIYWCILNISEKELLISGNVRIYEDDLVFRSYGNEFITIDGTCTLIIEVLEDDIDSTIQSVYLYCYEKDESIEIGNSTNIVCNLSEPGAYTVYAITEEGGIVNLLKYITVVYETSESPGFSPLYIKSIQY